MIPWVVIKAIRLDDDEDSEEAELVKVDSAPIQTFNSVMKI